MNEKTIKKLQSIVGKSSLLTEKEELHPYSTDETPDVFFMPEAVVKPENRFQIIDILKLANAYKFPVTARGGGTGLTGGSLPVSGGVVISFEKMDSIIDIDNKNRMAVVEPGCKNSTLQESLKKEGLFYPVNPASMDSCTLGGNVAEASGGANTVKYGTTRNYISGISAVSGNAELWKAGGKIVKNATDQILMQLMCGSEGTLSVFTDITFRAIKKPAESIWIIAPFKDIFKIPLAARKIMKISDPTMVELMDKNTMRYCEKYLDTKIQFSDFHQLLVRFDSDSKNLIEEYAVKAGDICLEFGSQDVLSADSAYQQKKIWKIRRSIHDAIAHLAGPVFEEDVVVPQSEVSELIKKAYRISDKYNMPVTLFGHLGDGNIHVNFSKSKNQKSFEKNPVIKEQLFDKVKEIGGKVSGEHGIGITKKTFFAKTIDPGYLKLLKKVKKDFDPNNILNPGKLAF